MELLNCMLKKLNYQLQLLEFLNMFLNFKCFIRMIFQSSAHLSETPVYYSHFIFPS